MSPRHCLTIIISLLAISAPSLAAEHRYKKIEPLSEQTPQCVKDLPV